MQQLPPQPRQLLQQLLQQLQSPSVPTHHGLTVELPACPNLHYLRGADVQLLQHHIPVLRGRCGRAGVRLVHTAGQDLELRLSVEDKHSAHLRAEVAHLSPGGAA